jgi:hypothetical protein
MRNGLYCFNTYLLDGMKGRSSGVVILRDGVIRGGDPYFWSVGSYTVGQGTWKGEMVTNQHTPFRDGKARPLFDGREVTSGFSGTYHDNGADVYGTALMGSRSVSFRTKLRRLADI